MIDWKKSLSVLVASSALMLLPGCDGDNNDIIITTDYTGFVKTRIATTSDTTDPIRINALVFRDRDRNNPQAYDDVLAP